MLRPENPNAASPSLHRSKASRTNGSQTFADWNSDELIRYELLSAEALEGHAQDLAATHRISEQKHSAAHIR